MYGMLGCCAELIADWRYTVGLDMSMAKWVRSELDYSSLMIR